MQAVKARIPVGLGTDSGCPYITHYDFWREVVYFNRLAGARPVQALHTATLGNARILHLDGEIGSVEVGKCADLFLVDDRRLELVGATFDPKAVFGTVGLRGPVDYTMVNGRFTVRNGRLCTVDEEALACEARRKCESFLRRA